MPNQPVDPDQVFLNIPCDVKFERLYLAYIAGITSLALKPRATLAIRGGRARFDRIVDLIHSCAYSVHDLKFGPQHPARIAVGME